jgi:hypothetical protein
MNSSRVFWSTAAVVTGVALTVPSIPAGAQARRVRVTPERTLLGISLGRPAMEVLKKYGSPNEIQTVALADPSSQMPGVGGAMPGGDTSFGASMGAPAFGGNGPSMGGMSPFGGGNGPSMGGMMPGGQMMPGAQMAGGAPAFGGSPYGGGSPFGGGNGPGGFGGPPMLPPAGGNGPGFGGTGMEGGFGGGAQMPEYSTAVLWIYKKPKGARYEFLINEDGRVAQISVAAPAGISIANAKTRRGVALGTQLPRVIGAYGTPERNRLLPGYRFYEAYYTKNYHAAFTMDTQKKMRVVRITIALAD